MSAGKPSFPDGGSFLERFQTGGPSESETSRPAASPTPEKETPLLVIAEGQEFVASPAFSSAVLGYFFGTGDKGTGYYLDKPPETGRQPALRKGLIPKKKSIVPGLKVAGGVVKKNKTAASAPTSEYLAEMQRYRQQSCTTESTSGHPLVK